MNSININKTSLELITVLGPTAVGKTKLAVKLAYELNGEIISADSRQIYKGMDIGTGKDLDEYIINGKSIPYHLIDIIDPDKDYSVFNFQTEFNKIYNRINKNGKKTILCGGTGLYLDSILFNYKFEQINANNKLRKKLDEKSKDELKKYFKKLDEKLYANWNTDTKRRIIRGIELANSNAKPQTNSKPNEKFNRCVIGIKYDREIIRKRITYRLKNRLDTGMIEEVQNLINNGLSINRLNYFGLEYKFVGKYLKGEINKEELFELLNIAIHQFAKRQSSWFRRMEKRGIKIFWIDEGSFDKAMKFISTFKINKSMDYNNDY